MLLSKCSLQPPLNLPATSQSLHITCLSVFKPPYPTNSWIPLWMAEWIMRPLPRHVKSQIPASEKRSRPVYLKLVSRKQLPSIVVHSLRSWLWSMGAARENIHISYIRDHSLITSNNCLYFVNTTIHLLHPLTVYIWSTLASSFLTSFAFILAPSAPLPTPFENIICDTGVAKRVLPRLRECSR